MSGLKLFSICLCICLLSVFVSDGPARAVEVKESLLFMKEYAAFVQRTLDREPATREKLLAYVTANKAKVREGFGLHPELVPGVLEAAGLERLACVTGRNYDELVEKLNREEAAVYYDTAQQLEYWALGLAVEEAAIHGIVKASPPLNVRPEDEVPLLIGIKVKKRVAPYSGLKLGPKEMKGLSFDKLPCD
jgi:hypothetical protein